MELSVYNRVGEDTGKKIQLASEIFEIEPNKHAVYLDVKQFMANNRQGTHKAKERNEISGSTKKLKRQKGTGGARAGSIKSPLFKGGGRVFGPQPRDYSFKLNKKVKRLARKSALTFKALENNIIIIEDFTLETPKTKEILSLKKNLNIENKKSLLVLPKFDNNIFLSSRNIVGSNVMFAGDLNTYSILNSSKLIFFESSVPVIEKTLKVKE